MSGPTLLVTPAECLPPPPAESLGTPPQMAPQTTIWAGPCTKVNTPEGSAPHGSTLGLPITTSPAADDEEEEITETKIIGVTETGVIRKRSFKRKLTKEEKMQRQFGNDKADYEKIQAKVLSERYIASAVEILHERWRMLNLIHEDCKDMVSKWEQRCQERRRAHQAKRDVDTFIVVAIVSAMVLLMGFIIRLIFW